MDCRSLKPGSLGLWRKYWAYGFSCCCFCQDARFLIFYHASFCSSTIDRYCLPLAESAIASSISCTKVAPASVPPVAWWRVSFWLATCHALLPFADVLSGPILSYIRVLVPPAHHTIPAAIGLLGGRGKSTQLPCVAPCDPHCFHLRLTQQDNGKTPTSTPAD